MHINITSSRRTLAFDEASEGRIYPLQWEFRSVQASAHLLPVNMFKDRCRQCLRLRLRLQSRRLARVLPRVLLRLLLLELHLLMLLLFLLIRTNG